MAENDFPQPESAGLDDPSVQDILGALPLGCAVVAEGSGHPVIWCSERFGALLGLDAASLTGASLTELLDSMAVGDTTEPGTRQLFSESNRFERRLHVLTAAGDERVLEVASTGSSVGGGVLVTALDATEDARSEEFARLRDDRCRAITDGARDMVFLVGESGDISFANQAAADTYGHPIDVLLTMNIRDLRAEETRSYVSEQMQAARDRGVLFETWHVRADGSAFPVEVSSRGVEIGDERAILSIVRDISARKDREIERERLLTELEQANGRLDALFRIVSSALDSVELDEMLDDVLVALRDVMGADAALLVLVEPSGLMVAGEIGVTRITPKGTLLPRDGSFAGRVVEVADAVYVADVTQSDFFSDIHREAQIVTMIGVPILSGGEVLGVVECAWSARREVADGELGMLSLAASKLASAVSGAQRFEMTRRAERLNLSIAEIAAMVGGSLEESASMAEALELAARVIDCDAGGFGSFAGNVWQFRQGFGFMPDTRIAVPFHAPSRPEPKQQLPVVLIDSGSERSQWLSDELDLAEAMVVPVAVGGEWTGAIVFGRTATRGGFDQLSVDFARRVSQTVSLAYGNIREFESEHRIAETLQESLLRLPEHVRGVQHASLYNSSTLAARVGGDFFDLFELPDGRVGALVGDVSGKGLGAAVLTSVIKDTVRAYAHRSPSPSEVMSRTNEVLSMSGRLPDFASALFLTIEPTIGRVRYCCAGHPPALAVRAGDGVGPLSCGSPVIGAFEDVEFEEAELMLQQGDTLVLYTDGVTEARAPSGAFYGDDRLLDAVTKRRELGIHDMVLSLFEEVAEFADGRLADDIALLALRLDEDCCVDAGPLL